MSHSKIQSSTQSFMSASDSAMNEPRSLTTERWLSSRESAEFLGISERALAMRVFRKEITPKKLGRLNRFNSKDLERLLRSLSETSKIKGRF